MHAHGSRRLRLPVEHGERLRPTNQAPLALVATAEGESLTRRAEPTVVAIRQPGALAWAGARPSARVRAALVAGAVVRQSSLTGSPSWGRAAEMGEIPA